MEYKTLPLFKSHYSLGKAILTLEKPNSQKDKIEYPASIFALATKHGLHTVPIVEDSITGLLQASKQAEESKVKLVFGLRVSVTEDMARKDDSTSLKSAKYIIMTKNPEGYDALSKLWSAAAGEGFFKVPYLDFRILKKLWNKNLVLAVPFYDSFLFSNTLYSHAHVPDLDTFEPVFFTEDNDLPFDGSIQTRVENFCKGKYLILPAQSIYYWKRDDFSAYVTFRCIHHRHSYQKVSIERPELDHMGSDTFCFERWLQLNS